MNFKNTCYSLILFIVCSCATYEPKYREPFDESGVLVAEKTVDKTFYLIGDAGYAKPNQSTLGLTALKKYIAEHPQEGDYTIFLGDNIYPEGMPDKESKKRKLAEHRLDAQIEAVKNFGGKVYFIPGNHDWYNKGLKGLKREEDYIEDQLDDNKLFKPKTGCALESIEISENVQLILFDSQWFLEDWDKHPTINDNCPEIKTREALFLKIESEFKKNQNKTILFALHHPLYTNGVHGGNFALEKHLFPSQKKIPLPGLASLSLLIRTSGGVSSQDNLNKQYKQLVNRLETLANATTAGNIIFASGHEHSLQYIEEGSIKQIVSGSGSKNSYATLRNNGLFAYGAQGFAKLNIYTDGSSEVSFFVNKDGKPELVYTKEIFPANKKFDTSSLKPITNNKIKASVYNLEGTRRTEFYKGIWGDHYRKLYGTKIETPVVQLDTLYGGLTVVRRGGGHQTRSLRLVDKQGREYNMRALRKSSVLFLQSTLFKDNYVGNSLKNTVSEDILQDFYTAAHPFAFLAIPKLADAVGVFHTNPKLYYIPKQEALKDYNKSYGDELYMIEERPEEGHKDLKSFGEPDDIESTNDLFERLRRDEKYKLDESAYIRARLFDMLIGDWDRHEDQWRWSEYKLENGNRLFKPIPRDRDQVFSNFDGAFLGTLRGLLGFANQFQVYGDDIKDEKWMNISALRMDRSLLNNSSKDNWVQQATYIKNNLSDQDIEEAFTHLPIEVQNETTTDIVTKLKGRRDNLVNIAERYYEYLAKLAIVTGTDKDDYIEIERLPKGKTKITISRIKDGEKADIVNEKIYSKEYTKEIWIYGLDDDDVFEVSGKPENPIKIRIIGGQNNDIYNIKKGRKITVYDHKTKPNTVKKKGGASFRFTDNYEVNHFNKDQRIFNSNSIVPTVGFNPDDGVKLGLSNTYTYNGFFRNPFTRQHQIRLGYYFATQSFDIEYTGEFAGLLGDYNVEISGLYSNPNFAVNFFGFGNDSQNNQDELDFDYNRVRLSRYGGHIGVVKRGRFGSYFNHRISIEGVEAEQTPDRFISESIFTEGNSRVFDRLWFAGAETTYRYESYDVDVNPTQGMKFEVKAGGKLNLEDSERAYGYIKPYLGFYNSIIRNRKLVLKTAVLGHFNVGRNYEFYQSAQIGGENLLRGYRNQRFSGQSALAGNIDLRYSFDQFKTRLLPLQIGVFVGTGTGRVWLEGADITNTWHSDFGGGFWLNSTDAIQGTLNLFTGEDGLRFSFGFSFNF
ncbi:metallophosphoesterase [uncultured Aquimarina sp.]|uniref:metallophosphoesterase n=1 Tax=uncultured Aquimarina sp. TaxID=575652 RepID=UPI00260A1864|nr:metallophosphoesterase [uncultured Aquimarina sp.]